MAILIFSSFFILDSWLHFPSNETSSGLQWFGFPFLLFFLLFLSAADSFGRLWSENIHVPVMHLTQSTAKRLTLATWAVTTRTQNYGVIYFPFGPCINVMMMLYICHTTKKKFFLFVLQSIYPTLNLEIRIFFFLQYTGISLINMLKFEVM